MKFLKLLLLLCIVTSHAQNSNTYYFEYKFYKLNNDKPNENKAINQYIGLDNVDTIKYELYINDHKAIFSAIPKLSNNQVEVGLNFEEIIIESYGSYFYDFKDSIFYNSKEYLNKKFSIKHKMNSLNWELSPKIDTIDGHICKVAKYVKKEKLRNGKERDYITTVWYSDSINHKSIPFGFFGLSGGIVKINFNNFAEVNISNQKIIKNKKPTIKSPKLGKIVTEEEYNVIIHNQSIRKNDYYNNSVDIE